MRHRSPPHHLSHLTLNSHSQHHQALPLPRREDQVAQTRSTRTSRICSLRGQTTASTRSVILVRCGTAKLRARHSLPSQQEATTRSISSNSNSSNPNNKLSANRSASRMRSARATTSHSSRSDRLFVAWFIPRYLDFLLALLFVSSRLLCDISSSSSSPTLGSRIETRRLTITTPRSLPPLSVSFLRFPVST